jgi:hypothetical protein
MSLTRVFGLPRRLLSLRCLLRGAQVSSLGVLLIATSACSKQGEGERCDLANFDEDCESGLTCTDLSTKRSNAQGAVCCAPNSTVDVCLDDKFSFDDDAGAQTSAPSSSDSDESSSSSVSAADAGIDAAASAPETSSAPETTQTPADAGASSSSAALTSSAEPSSSELDTATFDTATLDTAALDTAVPDAG